MDKMGVYPFVDDSDGESDDHDSSSKKTTNTKVTVSRPRYESSSDSLSDSDFGLVRKLNQDTQNVAGSTVSNKKLSLGKPSTSNTSKKLNPTSTVVDSDSDFPTDSSDIRKKVNQPPKSSKTKTNGKTASPVKNVVNVKKVSQNNVKSKASKSNNKLTSELISSDSDDSDSNQTSTRPTNDFISLPSTSRSKPPLLLRKVASPSPSQNNQRTPTKKSKPSSTAGSAAIVTPTVLSPSLRKLNELAKSASKKANAFDSDDDIIEDTDDESSKVSEVASKRNGRTSLSSPLTRIGKSLSLPPKPAVVEKSSSENESSDDEKRTKKSSLNESRRSEHEMSGSESSDDDSRKNANESQRLVSSDSEDSVLVDNHEPDTSRSVLCVEDLGSDDEVWLVQCPAAVSADALLSGKLDLSDSGRSRFLVEREEDELEYGAEVLRHPVPKSNTCLLRSRSSGTLEAVSLPMVGQIMICRKLPLPPMPSFDVEDSGTTPLPTGLKIRHPIFGANYKQAIMERDKSMDPPMPKVHRTKNKPETKPAKLEVKPVKPEESRRKSVTFSLHDDVKSFSAYSTPENSQIGNNSEEMHQEEDSIAWDEFPEDVLEERQSQDEVDYFITQSAKKREKKALWETSDEAVPTSVASPKKKTKKSSKELFPVENVPSVDDGFFPQDLVENVLKKKKKKKSKAIEDEEIVDANVSIRNRAEPEHTFPEDLVMNILNKKSVKKNVSEVVSEDDEDPFRAIKNADDSFFTKQMVDNLLKKALKKERKKTEKMERLLLRQQAELLLAREESEDSITSKKTKKKRAEVDEEVNEETFEDHSQRLLQGLMSRQTERTAETIKNSREDEVNVSVKRKKHQRSHVEESVIPEDPDVTEEVEPRKEKKKKHKHKEVEAIPVADEEVQQEHKKNKKHKHMEVEAIPEATEEVQQKQKKKKKHKYKEVEAIPEATEEVQQEQKKKKKHKYKEVETQNTLQEPEEEVPHEQKKKKRKRDEDSLDDERPSKHHRLDISEEHASKKRKRRSSTSDDILEIHLGGSPKRRRGASPSTSYEDTSGPVRESWNSSMSSFDVNYKNPLDPQMFSGLDEIDRLPSVSQKSKKKKKKEEEIVEEVSEDIVDEPEVVNTDRKKKKKKSKNRDQEGCFDKSSGFEAFALNNFMNSTLKAPSALRSDADIEFERFKNSAENFVCSTQKPLDEEHSKKKRKKEGSENVIGKDFDFKVPFISQGMSMKKPSAVQVNENGCESSDSSQKKSSTQKQRFTAAMTEDDLAGFESDSTAKLFRTQPDPEFHVKKKKKKKHSM